MGAFKNHHFVPSRSDFDWRAAKALKNFAGFVFDCSRSTFPDQERGIFGLPVCCEECVRNIHRGMPIFLFNRTDRCLYGGFEAASDGACIMDPHAWKDMEHSKSWRCGSRVSKYPAQVRVSITAPRLSLEEESFQSILYYEEGTKFLTKSQVQQLFLLFDAAKVAKRESFVERNRANQNASHNPVSPRPTTKSDSDSCSDCSSRGLNSWDDEWTDEAACENVHNRQGDMEKVVSERLPQIALDRCMPYDKGRLIPAVHEDRVGAGFHNDKELAWKRSSRKSSLYSGSNSDSAMHSRLQENDPAVNSNSNNCIQTGVDPPLALSRQDNTVTMPLISFSQMKSPFGCSNNMMFISAQKVPYQQRENATFLGQSQRLKWSDQKRYAGGGSMNSRKQVCNQDRGHKSSKDGRHQNQQRLLETVPLQSLNLQFNELLARHCSQGPGQAQQDLAQLVTSLPPLMIPSTSEDLTLAWQQTGVRIEEEFGIANNLQVSPEELQHFLQRGHVPPYLMPPNMQRPIAGPQPTGFVKELHFEVLQFARWTRPSEEVQLHVEVAIDCIRKGVKTVWPEADVEVFGSFATGLCLQHSDVDLVVIDAPTLPSAEGLSIAQASASLIRDLAAALKMYEWCESIKPLDTASMPVLKCVCRPVITSANTPTAVSSIAIDITIGSVRNSYSSGNPAVQIPNTADQVPTGGKFHHTGGAAREYVFHKIQELPALAPLVLLLKSFLHHRSLSNVYMGGLGSFSLTLLVTFYLERVAATREIFSKSSSSDLATLHMSSPVSYSSDLSDDSDAPSPSCNSGVLNCNTGSDSLGKRYVRRAADAIQKVLSLWDQGGSPHLGTLLLGFLQTFGFELDLSSARIVLKGSDGNPGGFFKRDDRHVALWIDDPLRPGVNIGAGSFGMVHVQIAFQEMLQALTKQSMFNPPLQCDDNDCLDLATISQLAHIGCMRITRATDDF